MLPSRTAQATPPSPASGAAESNTWGTSTYSVGSGAHSRQLLPRLQLAGPRGLLLAGFLGLGDLGFGDHSGGAFLPSTVLLLKAHLALVYARMDARGHGVVAGGRQARVWRVELYRLLLHHGHACGPRLCLWSGVFGSLGPWRLQVIHRDKHLLDRGGA